MKDFPAAHSNDTDWFAVDEDGNLALFEPRSEGASPAGWSEESFSNSWYDLSQKENILVCNWNFPIKEFPKLRKTPGVFISPEKSGKYDFSDVYGDEEFDEYIFNAYLFLIRDPKIIPLIAPGVTSLYFPKISGTDAALVIMPVVNNESMVEAVNQLIQEGEIVGFAGVAETIWFMEIYNNLDVYKYEPENGGWVYPYLRKHQPEHPVNIKDLPPGFPLSPDKMKVRFSETKRIQLMEIGYKYDDICTWNNAGWVALDGKVYDFDGNFLGMKKDL